MKKIKKTVWILAAAVGPLLAGTSMAQQRVGSDGHALDANNRVGGGGVNTSTPQSTNINNNIATNNVTGLFGFHGNDSFTDPTAFRIRNLPGSFVDRFNAVSAGVPEAGPSANYGNPRQPFFSQVNTATPPAGYVQNGTRTGYMPLPAMVPQDQNYQLGNSIDSTIPALPAPGQLNMPGPVDPTGPGIVTASQLYGIRQWSPEQAQAASLYGQGPVGPEQTATPTVDRMNQIRRELQGNIPAVTPDQGSNTGGPNTSGPLPSMTIPNSAITPQTASPQQGSMSTGQSNRRQIPDQMLAPGLQSAQYNALKQHLADYQNSRPKTDEEANREFQAAMQQITALCAKQQSLIKPLTPSAAQTPTSNPSAVAPGQALPPIAPSTPAVGSAPAPVQIKSIGEGMKSAALTELLTQAEDQIRQKHYAKSIDLYNEAAQAVPNNPLIVIGRANAELAGNYYRQAEADIRKAFQDRALVGAQFNLKELFGAARLEATVADLNKIAETSPKNASPMLLLAYLSYNSGSVDRAKIYLNEADHRSGGKDQLVDLLKNNWSFTEKSSTTQPSKEGGANQPLNLNPAKPPMMNK